MSVNDSITNTEMGGFMLDVQENAGVNKSVYQHFGEQIDHNTPAGFYNLSSGVGLESNINYGFYVTSGNTGKILEMGKEGAATKGMQMFNNGHISLNGADNNDDGNILQVYGKGSSGAITARQDNTGTNDVTYPLDIWRFTTDATASGFGMGIRFRSITSNSAAFPYIGNLTYRYTDPTQGTEDADFVVENIRAGSVTEALRSLSTGALRINNTYTLPATDGSNGDVLTTNGSGAVSWQTPSGGSSYTFTNGLTESAGTAKLGGALG
jgi:hypothetical protein